MALQPDLWKQFRANEGSTAGNQFVPQVIGLRNGNILVVWEDDTNGPSAGVDIMGRLFDPEGTAIGTPRQINSPSDFGETGPQIVALPDGGFAMAYGGFDAVGGFVQVERYDANAQSIASHQIRNPSINNWEITADAAGNYTVVYERRSATTDFDIYALTYNNQTNQPGPERNNVAYNGQENDQLNGLASFANGQIVTLGNEADDQGYQKTWFTVTDPATGALIREPSPPYGLLSLQQGIAQDVAVLESGRFVSLWNQSENFVQFGLWMNLRGLDPTDFTFPVQIALGTNRGHVLALPGGDFFVVWQPSNETTLYGRRYHPDGTPAAAADDIVTNAAINGIAESRPALTSDGRILVTYKDTSLEISLAILDPRVGNVLGTSGDDGLTARTSSTHMVGGAGNDRLYGRDGNDTMDGGDNDDQLFGRGGNDTLAGALGIDRLEGGPGDDIYVLHDANSQQVGTSPGGGPIIQVRFDEVIEAANGGVDTIQITRAGSFGFGTSYQLAPHVENGIIQFGNPFSLFGNELDNRLTGSSGADTVSGEEGNDTLNGGAGNDAVTGGAGFDVAVFSGNAAAYTITKGASSVTVAGPDGSDTLTGVERLQFQDISVALSRRIAGDFNGDARSDILFSHTGAVFASNYQWQMNDRAIASHGAIDLYDKAFTVQVVGDFNGDGKSDVVFENPATGGVWQWQLDGTAIASQGAVDVGDPSYRLLGSGDFNGDGKDDLLWRNDAGFVYEWLMNGRVNTPAAVQLLDPSWRLVGSGDFDGDGNADLLLRNISSTSDNGAFYLWQMDGTAIKAQGGIERPGTDWQTLGVGDFDGDGKSDFAVRHVGNFQPGEAPGAVWVYLMDGTTIRSQGAAGIADAGQFRVAGIGDYSGDGKDDILFRNDAGYFYSWDMNGTQIASEGPVPWADPSFKVVTQHWDVV